MVAILLIPKLRIYSSPPPSPLVAISLFVSERLQSMGWQRGRQDWVSSAFTFRLCVSIFLDSAYEMKGKVAQSCLTLWDPMDYTVHGILQAVILEFVAFPFSSRSSWPRNQTGVSCITDRFFTSWACRWYHMIFMFLCLTSLNSNIL